MHKAWTKIIHETVHQLVKAVQPRRDILTFVMIIPTFNHLPHIVEPIKDGWRLNIGVAYSCSNILEPLPRHVLRQPEGRSLKHVDSLLQPPRFVLLDPLKTCHKEVTAQPDIEIL